MKYKVLFFLVCFSCLHCYSQKEIIKNGQNINRLDKKNKKQGSWFFFNQIGDLEVSCYYKNDSIVTPIIFYKNNDSIFVRHQKVVDTEIFLLKSSKKWIVGSLKTIQADSTEIEILGRYVKIGKDTYDIQEDTLLTHSETLKKEIDYWLNREIKPIYKFGTEMLKDFYYRQFSSLKYVFSKNIVVDVTLDESGIIKHVAFPGKLNNINIDETSELSYMFSNMERWQPFFLKNKTEKHTVRLTIGQSVRY